MYGNTGQMCDECDVDGPPKRGFWGNRNVTKTSNLVNARGEFVTNAMETSHQKVNSEIP